MEFYAGGSANCLAIITPALVLGEHINLRNRLTGKSGDVLNVFQTPIVIEQISGVHESDAGQLIKNSVLLGVHALPHFFLALHQVRTDMRRSHQPVCTAVYLLHGLVRVTRGDICLAPVLIRVS